MLKQRKPRAGRYHVQRIHLAEQSALPYLLQKLAPVVQLVSKSSYVDGPVVQLVYAPARLLLGERLYESGACLDYLFQLSCTEVRSVYRIVRSQPAEQARSEGVCRIVVSQLGRQPDIYHLVSQTERNYVYLADLLQVIIASELDANFVAYLYAEVVSEIKQTRVLRVELRAEDCEDPRRLARLYPLQLLKVLEISEVVLISAEAVHVYPYLDLATLLFARSSSLNACDALLYLSV